MRSKRPQCWLPLNLQAIDQFCQTCMVKGPGTGRQTHPRGAHTPHTCHPPGVHSSPTHPESVPQWTAKKAMPLLGQPLDSLDLAQRQCRNEYWKKGKDPTPKTRFNLCTLLSTPGLFTTRPLPVHFTTKMSVVRPFSVLSKDKIGLSKTGRFLSKAEILGVGIFSPLSRVGAWKSWCGYAWRCA